MERLISTVNSKRYLAVALFMLCSISFAFSQTTANALYLKDGNRIIGHVMALDSASNVTIQTTMGDMVSVPMTDVDNINWSYVIKQTGAGSIYRFADKYRWVHNDVELSDRDYERFFDADLYHAYITGSNLFNIGGGCWLYSVACLAFAISSIDLENSQQPAAFYAYAGGAGVLAILGSVFTNMGKKRLNWVERTFNSQNSFSSENTNSSNILNTLKLNPSIMLTAQRDVSFGATLSLTF